MATKTAAQAAAKWVAAMQSPTTQQNYVNGINAVTVNPMQLAATPQAEQNYINGIQRAIQSGKRAKKLNAADPAMWKQNAVNIGAANLRSGATKGQPKYVKGVQPYEQVWAQMRQAARALPKGGAANATARFQAALNIIMSAAGSQETAPQP